MKAMRLFELLSELPEELIAQAEQQRRFPRRNAPLWGTLAAAVLCITLATLLLPRLLSKPPLVPASSVPPPSSAAPPVSSQPAAELPMLTIDNNGYGLTGGGMGGSWLRSIDDLVNENPWNAEAAPKTLPVFANAVAHDPMGRPTIPKDLEALQRFGVEIALRLGFTEDALTITDNRPTGERLEKFLEKAKQSGMTPAERDEQLSATEAVILAEGVKIEVDANRTASIRLDPPVELPEQYRLGSYSDYAAHLATAQYLGERYAALLGMEKPVVNIDGGQYLVTDTADQRYYRMTFYEGAGNLEEQIINYNFNEVWFGDNAEGALFVIHLRSPDLSNKLGDYPIVTPERAKELLMEGHYTETWQEPPKDASLIRKVELVYETQYKKVLMPYYRIYVENPDPEFAPPPAGFISMDSYNVPAVDGKYITNMPLVETEK